MCLREVANIIKLKTFCLIILISCQTLIAQTNSQSFINDYYTWLSKSKDSTLILCNQLISSNNNSKKAFGYAGRANFYTNEAKYKLADSLYKKSEILLRNTVSSTNVELRSNILYLKAHRYVETHEYEIALSILSEAIELCNGQCSFILDNNLYGLMGKVYSMSKNNIKAIEISRSSLQKLRNHPKFLIDNELKRRYFKELTKICSRLLNLYYWNQEKHVNYLDSAKVYTMRAQKFEQENDFIINNGFIELYFGDIGYFKKDYKKAKDYYIKSIALFKKKGNVKKTNQLEYKVAQSYYNLNEFEEAEKIFLKHIKSDIWAEYQLLDYGPKCYDYLSKIYNQRGKLDKAITYADSYIEKYEVYLAKKNSSDLNVNDKMHFEERKKEVKALKKEIDDKERKKKFYSSLSITLFLLVFVLASFFIYKNKKTKQNINKLNERILSLQQNISQSVNTTKISSLSDENALQLIEKLKVLEQEELYKDPNYSLNMVAKRLHTNSSYLSKTVNDYMHISFVQYSNRLKINSIVQRLNNEKSLRNYTIEALAKEAGYKSVNAFNTNFKKLLKIKPLTYIKELKTN